MLGIDTTRRNRLKVVVTAWSIPSRGCLRGPQRSKIAAEAYKREQGHCALLVPRPVHNASGICTSLLCVTSLLHQDLFQGLTSEASDWGV